MQKLFLPLNYQSIFKYLLAAILLIVPLYQKFPVINVGGTYVAVRAEDFLLFVAGAFWFVYFFRNKPFEFLKDKLNIAILLFIIVGFISVISAVLITSTAPLHLSLFHWLRRIEYLLPFFIALAAMRHGNKPKFFIEVLITVVVAAFIYGLGQINLGFPVVTTQNEEYAKGIALRWIPGARLPSTFAGHYDLAAFLVIVFPILFAYLFIIKKTLSRILLLTLVIVPGYWLFLQTESRVSFLAYLVGVGITLWILRKKIFIVPFLALSIIGMFVLSDLGSRYLQILTIYGNKITSIDIIVTKAHAQAPSLPVTGIEEPLEDRSTSIRLNVEWPRAIRAFTKNPLLGTGYSSISLATDNDYLRLLGEVGLAGTLAFFLLISRLFEKFVVYIKNIRTQDENTAFVAGFIGGLVGLLINATFIDVFEASKIVIIFWAVAGVALGIVEKRQEV